MKPNWFAFVVVLTIAANVSPLSNAGEVSLATLRSQFDAEVQRAMDSNGVLQCERNELSESLGASIVVTETKFVTVKRPTGELLEERRTIRPVPTEGSPGPSPHAVIGYNSRYLFRLKSWGEENGWILDRAIRYDTDEYTPLEANLRAGVTRPPFPAPQYHNCSSVPIRSIINHPNLKVSYCGPSPANPARVRLAFDLKADDLLPLVKIALSIAGWYDFDPDRGWSVVEREEQISLAPGATRKTHTTVSVTKANDLWVPVEEVSENTAVMPGSPEVRTRTTITFRCEVQDKYPVERFTLTHYGLPEPEGVKWEKPTPTYVYFILAAAGCLVLAGGITLVLRRWRRSGGQGVPK